MSANLSSVLEQQNGDVVVRYRPHDAEPRSLLPARPTRLIGREHEIEEVRTLLATSRLITLTGPGGVGKTALAMDVACAASSDFADGAVLASLAPVREPSLMIPAIAQAIGIPRPGSITTPDNLAAHLAADELLLVLDNLEQIVECGSDLTKILTSCPNIKMLTTSRTVLRVQGERVFEVPPLSLPTFGQAVTANDLATSGAIELFVERAQSVDSNFALDDCNSADVAEICRRLDGLPLAIELAASRTRMFSPAGLLPRLEKRLPLLTSGLRDAPVRQQTLRDTLAWSYYLLSSSEQSIFRQLSIFVGGFTLDAAENVCGQQVPVTGGDQRDSLNMIDILSSLVDHSLVRRLDNGTESRFGILETIREYGLELLESQSELDPTSHRHAEWVVGFAESIRLAIGGPDGPAVLDKYEREHPNIRAALGHALESGDGELGCRIVAAVWMFWVVRTYEQEGKQWIQRLVDVPCEITPSYRLEVLCALAHFHIDHAEWPEAYRVSTDGLALARKVGNEESEALMLALLAHTAWGKEDLQQANRLLEQALAMSCKSKSAYPTSLLPRPNILYSLAILALPQAQIGRARDFALEALEIWRQRGDSWGIAMATEVVGAILQAEGNFVQAVETYRTCFPLFRHVGEPVGLVNCCAGIGIAAIRLGRATSGVRLISAADLIRRELGGSIRHVHSIGQEVALADARLELGSRRFESAWRAGRELSIEEAVTEATTLQLERPQKSDSPFALTSRQSEVLRLMADGRTDLEIAETLFISYRTVNTHVQNILNKMGVDSRTAASTDAVRLGLI